MKLDWDLVRKILIEIEQLEPRTHIDNYSDKFDDYDPDLVGFHMGLLAQRGYIDGVKSNTDDSPYGYIARALTMNGYDFLDTIRNQKMWNKITTIIKTKGYELTFDTIKAAAAHVITTIF